VPGPLSAEEISQPGSFRSVAEPRVGAPCRTDPVCDLVLNVDIEINKAAEQRLIGFLELIGTPQRRENSPSTRSG